MIAGESPEPAAPVCFAVSCVDELSSTAEIASRPAAVSDLVTAPRASGPIRMSFDLNQMLCTCSGSLPVWLRFGVFASPPTEVATLLWLC